MNETPTIVRAPPRFVVRTLAALQRLLVRLSRRLSPPRFAVLEMVASKWRPACLEAVAHLGVADHLEDGPRDVAALAAALQVHEDALYRVLRALARDGVFREGPSRTFRLTSLSRPLLTQAPDSVRDIVRLNGTSWTRACWSRLERAVETGDPVFPDLYGSGVWDYLQEHPEQGEIFHRAMVSFTRLMAGLVPSAYDFSRCHTVVDLGGGAGELLAVILARHPTLKGIVFDLPQALEKAPATLARYGLQERCELVEGSFFDAVPEGGDVYLMKNIVHAFSDEKLAALLSNCRKAMQADGTLLLIESVVPEGKGPYAQQLDLLMLLSSDYGLERTRAQFATLLERYGFALERIVPTASPMSLIVARPNVATTAV